MNRQPIRSNALRRSPGRRATALLAVAFAALLVLLAPPRAQSQGEPTPPNAPAIVGGHEATPGEWPWQVALIHSGEDPYNGQYCGGTLVDPLWVVTAAHCVERENASTIQVLAGIHNLVDTDPDFLRLDVAEVIVHPDYGQATRFDSDLALLRLDTPATFRPQAGAVLPISGAHLAPADVGPLAGVTSTVTGWGNRLPNGQDYPEALQEVEVPILDNADCRQAYPGSITDNMLCAGLPQGGKDSCQGDSGGPLVVFSTARSRWELAGIVSWGLGCAAPGLPGVYTRVSRFHRWIADETGADPDYVLSLQPAAAEVCAGTALQVNVLVQALGGFNQPVSLSLAGLPPGGTATFSPAVITPPNTSRLTIATNGLAAGDYDLLVRGQSGGVMHGAALALAVSVAPPAAPSLLQPPANSSGASVAPRFQWTTVPGSRRYVLQVAGDAAFQHVIHSAELNGTTHALDEQLAGQSAYYWRVRAGNACGLGPASTVFRFTTGQAYCRTPDLAIPDGDEAGVSDGLTLDAAGVIGDLDVFLRIDHSYVGDLRATVTRADRSQSAALLSGHLCSGDDVLATFDDEGDGPVSGVCNSASPAIAGRPIPSGSLAAFDGQTLAGQWELHLTDVARPDAGRLEEWCLLPTLLSSFCDTATGVPAAECASLNAFFTATDGWRWADHAGWFSAANVCQWRGVTCAGGHVSGLRLPGNGLNGALPPAIAGLPHLATLDLSGNAALRGPLPGGMTALALDLLWFNGTGLCAPPQPGFTAWLGGIDDLRVSGRTCGLMFIPLARR